MKYEKAKVIRIDEPRHKEEKINKTLNEGIKNGWQPINISSYEQSSGTIGTEVLYILMGKTEDE